jgi:glycerol-3-phosphate dehydrogenase
MTISLDVLATVTGGQAINFNNAEQAINQVTQRAGVCRALHAETQRLSGGQEPRPGTDAYAMAAATRSCWASFGNQRR